MDIFILIFTIVTLISLFLILFNLHALSVSFSSTLTHIQTTDERKETFNKSELTSYELERLEREEEFDGRINRLKDELAAQQHVILRGTLADELHPSVHNLPHDSVQTIYDVLPDVEYSE